MNSEKRYLLAIVLTFVVLFVFYGPLQQAQRKSANQAKSSGSASVNQALPLAVPAVSETDRSPSIGPAEYYELSNDIYSVKFSNRGAGISELILKGLSKTKTGRVELIKPESANPAFAIHIPNQSTDLAAAEFKLERLDPDRKTVDFILDLPGQFLIRKHFELIADKSAFRLKIGIQNVSDRVQEVPLEILSQIHFGEAHGYDLNQIESFVVPAAGKIKVSKESAIVKNPVRVSDKIEWQALTKKYFSVIVKPDTEAIYSETKVSSNRQALESLLRFAPKSVEPGATLEQNFLVRAGPEYYEDLKSFDAGFEQTLTQGIWGLFRYYLFISLRFCHRLTANYGFAIMLLTVILKVLFAPFTHMSFESMKKMQVIQPKMKSLQTQFKNDPARLNKEMMELYRRYKVNPMGGCLPMLLQLPIFLGFYQVLSEFVELKGESLWWFRDLTEPDRLARLFGVDINLLPVLMVGSMIWQQKVTPQASTSPEQAKMMQFMPLIMGFFFYSLPSGLVLYWTLSNLLTIAHQIIFHKRFRFSVDSD